VLWGLDVVATLPVVTEPGPRLLTVNCGSAVRACVPIGERGRGPGRRPAALIADARAARPQSGRDAAPGMPEVVTATM